MQDNNVSSSTPQFSKAEYAEVAARDICNGCKAPITGVYYRANGTTVCGSCAERLQRELPQDSHAAFVRSLLFGAGGFLLGLALYAGFTILTGIEIGYVSLAVGFIVGKAMMLGSKGVGGRRYQVTAVLLTYAAVSTAFIPIAISVLRHEKKPAAAQHATAQTNTTQQASSASTPDQPVSTDPEQTPPPDTAPAKPKMNFARAIGGLVLIGLASPFLQLQEGFSGVIGLVILFVGMQFAWKMTAGHSKIAIEGPYQNSASATA
jgi:hypothetical protein